MSAIRRLVGIATLIVMLCVLITALSASPTSIPARQAGKSSQSDLDSGQILFDASCSECHGGDATGGEAPNIQREPASLGDDAVVKIIKGGVPGTGMPAFAGMTDAQALQIVAYIRLLAGNAIASKSNQPVTGDPEKGKAVYTAVGCANCHMIAGEGGDNGPELTQIGSARAPDLLRATLMNPASALPKSAATGSPPTLGKWIEYLIFRAVTKNGQTVEGMRVTESSLYILLEDSQGNYHSLYKPDLRTIEREPGKSYMPSFKTTLSTADLDNLVAYLASLKGPQ